MNISTSLARAELTKALVDVYKERPKVYGFLRSFFPTKTSTTLTVSIEVKRGTEYVAEDVERGTEGNRNNMSRSTEKIFLPPLYKEYFDATQLAVYDRLFASTEISAAAYTQFLEELAEGIGLLEDKIERSYELQCSQVLQTGIVQLNGGTNIDFKRKAAHIVDLTDINANRYWLAANDATATPIQDMINGAKLNRENGKSQGGVFNVVLGSRAYEALIGMPNVIAKHDIKSFDLGMINAPQRNSVGASFHGVIAGGSYSFRLWTYPEVYESSTGTFTPYIDETYMIIIPETPKFKLAFAAVPQLITNGQPPRVGSFVYSDFPDPRKNAHDFIVESAGVAIPTAVDQIYTVKVLA